MSQLGPSIDLVIRKFIMAKPVHLPETAVNVTNASHAGSPISGRITAEGKSMTVVTIGNVTVEVPTPTDSERKIGLAESERASRAFVAAIPWHGVHLDLPSTAPLFEADSKDPALVIRKLGKTRTLGRFDEHGRFVKVKR